MPVLHPPVWSPQTTNDLVCLHLDPVCPSFEWWEDLASDRFQIKSALSVNIAPRAVVFTTWLQQPSQSPLLPQPPPESLKQQTGPDRFFVKSVWLTNRDSNHRSSPALSREVHQREQRLSAVVRVNTCCVRLHHGACQREESSPQIVQHQCSLFGAIKGNCFPRCGCQFFIPALEVSSFHARLDHLISGAPGLRTARFQARFHSNLPMWARITLRQSPVVLFIGCAVYAMHRDQCQP